MLNKACCAPYIPAAVSTYTVIVEAIVGTPVVFLHDDHRYPTGLWAVERAPIACTALRGPSASTVNGASTLPMAFRTLPRRMERSMRAWRRLRKKDVSGSRFGL
ncbi:hypothetical protein B0H65DRAFT_543245 [Neurospora tetraspora]|uniref:Uncharacterized protein n=1 Tax=Neurospora tetraspora TaxID=94610 RepID=A0AAE0MK31_9PEZI|nr:hypothetical protein B0H65DRAFT_543245 [Neurospora tetraspora]